MTCALSTHQFCCQDAHCFKRSSLWNACRKDVWFGLHQVRVKNIFPQAAHLNSHHLSVRKRRDCPVTTVFEKGESPSTAVFFVEEELPYLSVWQKAEAGGVSTCTDHTAQPPPRHAWSTHTTAFKELARYL